MRRQPSSSTVADTYPVLTIPTSIIWTPSADGESASSRDKRSASRSSTSSWTLSGQGAARTTSRYCPCRRRRRGTGPRHRRLRRRRRTSRTAARSVGTLSKSTRASPTSALWSTRRASPNAASSSTSKVLLCVEWDVKPYTLTHLCCMLHLPSPQLDNIQRPTRFLQCFDKNRPRNDLLCVEWDVKPCILTRRCSPNIRSVFHTFILVW